MTNRLLHLDFEVFSEINLLEAPFELYATHPSTKIILAAYAFEDEPVKVWELGNGQCQELRDGLRDPGTTIVAWNTTFERSVLAGKGMNIPLERWLDPMIMARYAGLPGRLKDCAQIPMIGIPPEEKTKNETLLINKFCKPQKDGRVIEGKDAPEDWQLFIDYCRKDVLTMRHIYNWLVPRFPFPARELEIWRLDQRINGRGFPVDSQLAKVAAEEAERVIAENIRRLRDITGLENPNSVRQLLPWLNKQGYPFPSLGRPFIERALGEDRLSAEGRQVCELRLLASKSSIKKFDTFVRLEHRGRITNQFVFYGAHTGRWSGRDVQPQNLPRTKTDQETLCQLRSKVSAPASEPVSGLEQARLLLSPTSLPSRTGYSLGSAVVKPCLTFTSAGSTHT